MKESKIQAEIVKYLQSEKIFCFSVPNEGSLDKIRTMQLITMGLRPGAPDLIVFWPEGRITFFEVKTQQGRLSSKQELFRSRSQRHGVDYHVVRSVEDVKKIIEQSC